ncbi:MAG: amidohydrolase [Cellvibrionales bacterium]|jgi:hippurate hydrolase
MIGRLVLLLLGGMLLPLMGYANADLEQRVDTLYDEELEELFLWFHQNPELSHMEHKTAARLASELEQLGYDVHTGIGGTGIVALMDNGDGPLVMFRADMDGLPVQEKSGLPYASTAKQVDWDGNEVYVMHACGHDVHVTSLVGTARIMAERRDQWQGTLMLIGQPAEERVGGARLMREDDIWTRFGQPDYAMALHVTSTVPTGMLIADPAPYSGADTVDILIKGVGAHGASPHSGVDPVLLGAQIVVALQSVVSRNLPPRRPGVITVGSFHSGTKHNIISDSAKLQLTVRSESASDRALLLAGIKRVAENSGRLMGLPEDMLPEVVVYENEGVPPTLNDIAMLERMRGVWTDQLGEGVFYNEERLAMGAEDFPFFTVDPYIPSVYFAVGGTDPADFERQAAGGPRVPSHHSPLFKIVPEPSVELGVKASVTGLMNLLQAP